MWPILLLEVNELLVKLEPLGVKVAEQYTIANSPFETYLQGIMVVHYSSK